jgi:phage terminase small subunit
MPALSNPKHERFCLLFVKGETAGNATASYKAAGYSGNRRAASVLGQRPDIRGRVAELSTSVAKIAERVEERLIEKGVATQEWIIERLVENVNRAMQAVAVLDSNGEPTGEYKYDGAVANKALELLGKERGMFVDRSVSLNVNYVISDEPLTAEEWAAECVKSN